MHRLTSSFVLGYHGCDRNTGERLLEGAAFKPSDNDYDWLGPGVYFWEANLLRGLEFARETSRRKRGGIIDPFVIGAVISLVQCKMSLETRPIPTQDEPERSRMSQTSALARIDPVALR